MVNLALDLQRFADDESLFVDTSDEGSVVVPDTNDPKPAAEAVTDTSGKLPEDTSETPLDSSEGVDTAASKGTKVVFTAEQQAHVDQLVEGRTARAERSFQKQLAAAAGVDLDARHKIKKKSLWGVLKANPELSVAVQEVIDAYVDNGRAAMPSVADSIDNELSKREAILDLKEADSTFAKNSKTILEWADEAGFNVTDGKSLKFAYLAWKGENSALLAAQAQLNAQRKMQAKTLQKQGAVLERGKGTPTVKKVDYLNMSDRDILTHEGLALFIDD